MRITNEHLQACAFALALFLIGNGIYSLYEKSPVIFALGAVIFLLLIISLYLAAAYIRDRRAEKPIPSISIRFQASRNAESIETLLEYFEETGTLRFYHVRNVNQSVFEYRNAKRLTGGKIEMDIDMKMERRGVSRKQAERVIRSVTNKGITDLNKLTALANGDKPELIDGIT